MSSTRNSAYWPCPAGVSGEQCFPSAFPAAAALERPALPSLLTLRLALHLQREPDARLVLGARPPLLALAQELTSPVSVLCVRFPLRFLLTVSLSSVRAGPELCNFRLPCLSLVCSQLGSENELARQEKVVLCPVTTPPPEGSSLVKAKVSSGGCPLPGDQSPVRKGASALTPRLSEAQDRPRLCCSL